MEPLNDNELRDLLRQWEAPAAPQHLERRIFGEPRKKPWYRWLLTGSIPGILLGSQMSIQVPERALRVAFSVILCLSGIKLLNVPRSSEIIVGALAVGAVILSIYSIRQLYFRRPTPLADGPVPSTTPGPERG